jgi:hypothetical protein
MFRAWFRRRSCELDMALYRIHRMKESARQQFRWAPHTIGVSKVKPKDYEIINSIQAVNVYAAWMALKDTENGLRVGDILEVEGGELRIYKYVGFEEAEWQLPETKPALETATPVDGGPAPAPTA